MVEDYKARAQALKTGLGSPFATHAGLFCLLSAFLAVVSLSAVAQSPNAAFNDGIDRSDPNFVTASLLVMSPGDELYSCAGHSCIRMECPTFNLDYCFSYEGESVKDKIGTFFMGKLKMGMFAIPTAEYIRLGRESQRGVMQYKLNLPPDAKQRLWKILDQGVAEGPSLPYDYVRRGCAQSTLINIINALKPYQLVVSHWPDKFSACTRRELGDTATVDYPWHQFVLHFVCGIGLDTDVDNFGKVVISEDLLQILRLATINDRPVIENDGVELVKSSLIKKPCRVTPFAVSLAVVGLSFVNLFLKRNSVDFLMLGFQSFVGLLATLLLFSGLPTTSWNWLIVPFNLLPLVFWKWRQKWALWFAGVLVLWEIGMIAYPHRLTDPAYLVLVGAYIIFYLKFTRFGRDAFNRVHYGMATCKGFLQAQTGDNP